MGESGLEKQISWRKRDASAQLRVLVVSLDELVVRNAHVVSSNEKPDVALLQLEPYTGKLPDLIPIAIGDSRAVRPGQWVISMGHPWGVVEAAASAIVVEGGSDPPGIARRRKRMDCRAPGSSPWVFGWSIGGPPR